MQLWPERVVPKCAQDRSLDELVKACTYPAVKSALKSLLDAPAAPRTGKKSTKGKANA